MTWFLLIMSLLLVFQIASHVFLLTRIMRLLNLSLCVPDPINDSPDNSPVPQIIAPPSAIPLVPFIPTRQSTRTKSVPASLNDYVVNSISLDKPVISCYTIIYHPGAIFIQPSKVV
ncbi:hypothetical protein LIER_37886 [Lithospermum erythrorhizon]|uniref:Secreted protein n=1 Tax=Lithospermum erythrorhizon TaxID=34254 RepID=A0AAV3PT32_LITER